MGKAGYKQKVTRAARILANKKWHPNQTFNRTVMSGKKKRKKKDESSEDENPPKRAKKDGTDK